MQHAENSSSFLEDVLDWLSAKGIQLSWTLLISQELMLRPVEGYFQDWISVAIRYGWMVS